MILALVTAVAGCTTCSGGNGGCGGNLCVGQGDCDRDSDCAMGLKCGSDNCNAFRSPAGWPVDSDSSWDTTDDCCYDPSLGGDGFPEGRFPDEGPVTRTRGLSLREGDWHDFEVLETHGAGIDGDDSLDVRNVPYMVPHRSVAKRWQGYMLCTKDGLKERDWRFTRSFAERFPDKSAPIVVGCKTGGDISMEPIRIETDPSTGRTRQVIPEGSSQYGDKSKSNSLMAIYELQQAGYTNLYHLDGGVTKWCVDGERHQGDPYKFYFHPTILPGILFQLIMVEGIVVRSNMAYVKKFHPESYDQINNTNALYGIINDLIANSPINWMFDYYS